MASRTALLFVAGLALATAHAAYAAPVERADAFRFLEQATFGPTQSDIDRLIALGDSSEAYERWIDDQISIAPSLLLPVLQAKYASGKTSAVTLNTARQDAWFRTAVIGPDQLRQRVAFALSEIMVISQRGALDKMPLALAGYYDILTRNAFGSFRQLIEEVTLHPAMGVYLSMLGNQKPDLALNIRPDENYARELMQLFTIGLVQLNPDGTIRTDDLGQPIPTYDQSVIEGFANVFTGWTYAGASSFANAKRTIANQVQPMQVYPEQHSMLAKRLLDYPGVVTNELPTDQTPAQDLAAALDNVFNHPNVAPFITRRLIQRLVTSNPSPGYITRVASVFADDGGGQHGQLGAVVRAILLDPEARPDLTTASDVTGKLKEPLLRLIQLWRAYDARAANGVYRLLDADGKFGQGHLQSPSVFNFFTPGYAPQGEITERGLVAPEMQIATEDLNTQVTNYFYAQVFKRNSTKKGLSSDIIVINIVEEVALATDPDALVQRLSDKLLGGQISPDLAMEARAAVLRWGPNSRGDRVADAMYMIVTSPQFAVQR
jgi:uncharacterized protein (DUF1800 family)